MNSLLHISVVIIDSSPPLSLKQLDTFLREKRKLGFSMHFDKNIIMFLLYACS